MSTKRTQKLLEKAKNKIESEGNPVEAYDILKPFIKKKCPKALFLFSMFSLPHEADEQFEQRSVDLLKQASASGYAPAQFALGLCYEGGGILEQDPRKAAKLYREAAINGYAKAQLRYGLDLFYGSNGVEKNTDLNIKYIRKASDSGIDEASEFLKSSGTQRSR